MLPGYPTPGWTTTQVYPAREAPGWRATGATRGSRPGPSAWDSKRVGVAP